MIQTYEVKYIFGSFGKTNLSNLLYQLRANKLFLNIQKTKLMFHPASLKIDPAIKFKLPGKQLIPNQSVKYLGVLLHEHSQWTKQLSNVKIKLNRTIGILSRLRHNSNLGISKTTYHSLFGLHLLHSCKLWGQKNKTKPNSNT